MLKIHYYKLMKMGGQKLMKNDAKMTPYNLIKKWLKIDLPWGGLK
jgi:hypothetical protein